MEIISSILLLSSLLVLSVYLYHYFTTSPHGFKNYPIIGVIPDFLINRNRFLEWTTQVLIDCPTKTAVVHRGAGYPTGVMTANPSNIEHILKTNFENYPKGERFISQLQDLLGNGIFNSDGQLWRMQRKTASYEFNTKSLRVFLMENVWMEISSRLIPILSDAAKSDRILDLQDVLERFGFDNICKLAFNFDPDCLGGSDEIGAEFMKAFQEAAMLSLRRFMCAVHFLWKWKKSLNIGSERALKKSISVVHEFADTIIRNRMESREGNKEEDLLSRFIGKDENSTEFIRDIIISFILAGRDSTSSALSWFFWLLSLHPRVEKLILKELEEIRRKNGKQIGDSDSYSMEQLRDMNYLHAAISESMRLYPPVALDEKVCLKDDVLPDGTFVGKGWFLTYNIYAMGRMREIWGEDCCEFRPERWLDGEGVVRQESPFWYPVFHAGPRTCLGKDMAYIQMKSIVAAVMERFVVEMVEKEKRPEHVLSLTLRMKGGLAVRIRERSY